MDETVKLKTYDGVISDSSQSRPRSPDLERTSLKDTNRRVVELRQAIIEHRLLVKVLAINPLQRDPTCGTIDIDREIMAALDFQPETIHHVPGGMKDNADVMLGV
jgi:hypothetical protein